MGCTYERKHLAGTDSVGCTCDRKECRRIIVFFSSTVCISIFERSPVAHDLILSSVCARRAYPRWFLGRVGTTAPTPTLTWRRFQMPSRKGLKNHLFRTDAYQCHLGAPWRVVPCSAHLRCPSFGISHFDLENIRGGLSG